MAQEQITGGSKSRKVYSFVKQQARRDRRGREADDRQLKYDKLTLKEKIALAKSRGGSKRELARLEAKVKTSKS